MVASLRVRAVRDTDLYRALILMLILYSFNINNASGEVWCDQVTNNITFEFKHPANGLSLAWEHKVVS